MGHNLTTSAQQDDYQEIGLFNVHRQGSKYLKL